MQTYSTSISDFLQFLIDGGEIGDFSGDLSLILSYINDLQSAGRLSGEFSGATLDALLAYSAFIADGGAPADFTGFDDLADVGEGGNPDAGAGYSAGPAVNVVAGVDSDAIANFPFLASNTASQASSFTPPPKNAGGVAVTDRGEQFGNNRLSTPRFDVRVASRDADGLPNGSGFSVRDMDLIAAARTGDILLTRHTGMGTSTVGGRFSTFDGGVSLDTAFIANPSSLLPTSGQVIYDLTDTLSVQVLGDYDGDVTLDAVLGLQLGTRPVAAVNGVLSADVDYIFSTGSGDASSGIDFSNGSAVFDTFFGVTGQFVSGEGVFCSQVDSCSAIFALRPTSDYSQLGGVFRTRSFSDDDAVAYTAVSFLARDGSSVETIIPDVTPSGSVIAPFGLDRATLLRASGGSSNRSNFLALASGPADLGFDDQGLSEMYRGFSNSLERGEGAVADLAGDEGWQVGRWIGRIGPDVYSPNSGLSYALVPLMSRLPANGRVDYTLLGATRPVYGNGITAPGTFDGSAVLIIDTTASFGIDATVTMPDAIYTLVSNGGLEEPGIALSFNQGRLGGSGFSANLTTTVDGDGAACATEGQDCNTSLAIAVGGDSAEYAGITYVISDSGDNSTGLSGTAVFGGELVLDAPDPLPEGIERQNQHVVYASTRHGIDNRDPATVIYDETTGAPLAYQWELNEFTQERERPQIGTAAQGEAGSAGDVLGWVRWTDGRTAGRYFDNTDGLEISANTGWHVLSGTPATNLPTSGTVSYDLIGNTAPTRRDGTVAPGTLDSAQAAVQFGTTSRVGVELGVSIGGESYSLGSVGGVSDLSQGFEIGADQDGRLVLFGGAGFNGTATASGGSLCSGDSPGCNVNFRGFLAGEGASHLGLAYTFGSTGYDSQVDGTAAFAAGDAVDDGSGGSGPEGTERSGQVTAYAATTIGIDSRSPTTVTYDDTTGAPLAYSSGENESPQIGTAMQRESGSAGDVIGWTRWAGGRTAGRYYSNTEGVDLPENAGWHLVSGSAATNLPASGTVQYDLIGSTAPTIRDGSANPGTLDSARAAVAFSAVPRVGLEMDLTVDGEAYNFTTIGGVSDLSEGLEIRRNNDPNTVQFFGNGGSVVATGGSVCDGNRLACGADVRGFLAGDGASHLGISYSFGAASRFIQGTAAFAADTAAAAQSTTIKAERTLTPPVIPATPPSAGTPDPVVPPVIDSTWTRWTQPSGDLLDRPTEEPDRIGGPLTPQGKGALMPSWISYDRR